MASDGEYEYFIAWKLDGEYEYVLILVLIPNLVRVIT